MPNHTANVLTVETDDQKLLGTIKNTLASRDDNGQIFALDLNKITKMPEELDGISSPPNIFPTQEAVDKELEKRKKENAEYASFLGRPITQEESEALIEKHGSNNWYDWCLKNWSTKWNAYDVGEWNGNKLYFETAWSPPQNAMIKLSEQFPEATFILSFADEGGGFLGQEIYARGEIAEMLDYEWRSEEGIELRKQLGCYHEEEEEYYAEENHNDGEE